MKAPRPCLVPPPVPQGGHVRVVAPASPFVEGYLHQGADLLRSWGLTVSWNPAIMDRRGYLAGEDRQRAALVEEAFADPEVHAVLCARGGYGCHRLLPLLNLPGIAAQPKRFFGFSDVTLLHLALQQTCGMASFHAPMVASDLLINGTERSRQSLRDALFNAVPGELEVALEGVPLQPGRASGPLVGGNLALLAASLGTPWQLATHGAILLIEDTGEPPYRLDRMMAQLRLAGLLDGLAGLVVGDVGELKDQHQRYEPGEFWADLLSGFEGPVMVDAPVGHIKNNVALPLGVSYELDAGQGVLRLR